MVVSGVGGRGIVLLSFSRELLPNTGRSLAFGPPAACVHGLAGRGPALAAIGGRSRGTGNGEEVAIAEGDGNLARGRIVKGRLEKCRENGNWECFLQFAAYCPQGLPPLAPVVAVVIGEDVVAIGLLEVVVFAGLNETPLTGKIHLVLNTKSCKSKCILYLAI